MENVKPSLAFDNNSADEEIGLGDAGIETFKSDPFSGVARECGQNSADARMGNRTVRLDFDLLTVPTETFPDIAAYRKVVAACKPQNCDSADKGHQFFTQAERVLAQPELKILRIADLNTHGLKGPARKGTPFHGLVKGYGVSNKQGKGSGGSFGIGKNAVFALSDIQTVFYSTLYEDEAGERHFLAQGKTILVSHEQDGVPKRGTGYWGNPHGFMPVEETGQVPSWLVREDIGTSIFAIGLRDEPDWAYRIAASLVRNFFCAVHRGRMEFVIDNGAIVINGSTIGGLFGDERLLKTVRETGEEEDFIYSKNLYECLVSEGATEEVLQIEGFGGLRIRMVVREDQPKGVCFIRNGMIITRSLEAFGERFHRFGPSYKGFIAVIEPTGDVESEFLKALENPAHDKFSAQEIPSPEKRNRADKIMRQVAKEIRRIIKKEALPEIDEESDLDEMGEFFGDDSALERIDPQGEEAPQTYKPAPVQKKPPSPVSRKQSKDKGGTGGGAEFEPAGRDSTKPMEPVGEGQETGTGDGGKGGRVYTVPADLSDFRNYIPKGAGRSHRRIIFTPNVTGTGKLHLMAAGLYDTAPLKIEGADKGTATGGGIVVEFIAGQKMQIDAVLSEDFDGPVEALATAEVTR